MLRRTGMPAGGLVLLCAVLVVPARAATPSPDPPPVAVAPEPPPAARTQPARVRQAPVTVAPRAPVVRRAAPVVRAQSVQTPAAKPKPVVKPKPTKRARVTKRTVVPASAVPHDRGPVPLAAFVPTVEELNRGLAALAGLALAFVALGGAVVLVAARRELAR